MCCDIHGERDARTVPGGSSECSKKYVRDVLRSLYIEPTGSRPISKTAHAGMITLFTVCIALTNCMQVFPSKWFACDEELKNLKKALTNFCVKHEGNSGNADFCQTDAASILQHGTTYSWGDSMATGGIDTKVPVFWAGFSEYDTSGMATKKNLSDFVKDVNGLLLHGGGLVEQTEWGMAVQALACLKLCRCFIRLV